jgi:hypothetical protein
MNEPKKEIHIISSLEIHNPLGIHNKPQGPALYTRNIQQMYTWKEIQYGRGHQNLICKNLFHHFQSFNKDDALFPFHEKSWL